MGLFIISVAQNDIIWRMKAWKCVESSRKRGSFLSAAGPQVSKRGDAMPWREEGEGHVQETLGEGERPAAGLGEALSSQAATWDFPFPSDFPIIPEELEAKASWGKQPPFPPTPARGQPLQGSSRQCRRGWARGHEPGCRGGRCYITRGRQPDLQPPLI